jgi:hypothetical protein
MTLDTLTHLSDSLPEHFDFYSFGKVLRSRQDESPAVLASLTEGKSAFSFKLLGDPAALLIVLFDSHLDASMYSELGNILASKLCQTLSEQGEGDLMITPPLALRPEQLARLSKLGIPYIHRSYEHVDQGQSVLIETLILPMTAEGQVGHA